MRVFLVFLNEKINAIVWGPPLLILILGVGIFLTIGIKFLQFTRLRKLFKEIFSKPKGEGDISPFAALNVALGGTVGVGNIAGVATAIALGGPGAVFWMWISGILGMAIKFSEVVLGVNFRVREENGPMLGGPMMYIKRGMPKAFHFLAYFFAIFGALAAFGIGNMTQSNSVAYGALEFGIPRYITGGFLIIAVGLVTIGGIKRIANVAMVCVPFMCGLYLVGAIVIIISHISDIPAGIILIFKKAFSPQAAVGGFAGATVLRTIKYGIARGVFSNEAGLGSAPMAHATARTDHPARQGLWGIFEVFVDTIIMCTATALVIILTGVWKTGQTGALLTMSAFSKTFGESIGFPLVVICMALTAYDTNLAWCFYGESCSAFLLGHRARVVYRFIWLPFVLIGALGKLEIVWSVADTLNGLMAIPNLIALLFLGGLVFSLTKNFLRNQKQK